MDFNRFEKEVCTPFRAGQNPIEYGLFDWNENRVTKREYVHHAGRLIVEGVGLFRPELLHYFAYKIWIDCPIELAIARGKKRDREEYHNPQDEKWDGIWKKNDLECYQAYTPEKIADEVIHVT